jgi:hypothetical protein
MKTPDARERLPRIGELAFDGHRLTTGSNFDSLVRPLRIELTN